MSTLLESVDSLHKRIRAFEKDKNTMEFHRMTPLLSPTLALQGSAEACGGSEAIARYLKATGLKPGESTTKPHTIMFSPMDGAVKCKGYVELPIRAPGAGTILSGAAVNYLKISVLEPEHLKDCPIKFGMMTAIHPDASLMDMREGYKSEKMNIVFPALSVPKCGVCFDLHPFPSDGDDEGWTRTFGAAYEWTAEKLVAFLKKGIVKVVFTKLSNGKERILYGTKNAKFIPADKRPKEDEFDGTDDEGLTEGAGRRGAGRTDNPNWVRMFDVEIGQWRSCRLETISEVRVKFQPYPLSYLEWEGK